MYLDINSVSPETKREIARSPGQRSPANLRGGRGDGAGCAAAPASSHAARRRGRRTRPPGDCNAIGMNVKPVSERIGVASAIKMCRSIFIKGLEAITVESMFTARRYGAEKQVLASLAATYPDMGWDTTLPDYLISRVAEHGKRRAAEMREAAQAIADAGLEPLTALATSQRQDWLAQKSPNFP